MNKKIMAFSQVILTFGIPLVFLSGCGAATQQNSAGSTTSNGNVQVVHVVASDWKWTLDKKTFSSKEPIEFDISSKEGTHGFSIDGTNISKAIPPGHDVQITWTPPKAGKYTIRCDIYCGSGHDRMYTAFTVK